MDKIEEPMGVIDLERMVSLFEQYLIGEALRQSNNVATQAAKLLTISPGRLIQKMKKYGFPRNPGGRPCIKAKD